MSSLVQLSLNSIVDNLEIFMVLYDDKWKEINSDSSRPLIGPFGPLESPILTLIIEELIKKELLNFENLIVLLPEDAERLTCDENTRYSPFGCNTIDLISKRCPNFKVLHCHYDFVRIEDGVLLINLMLRDSIQRLKFLQEIDFCDSFIKKETIQMIALNCHQLRELNLRRTNISDEELNCLFEEESVLKNSLTKLIINETNVSADSILQCLLNLQNLTHFQSDRTIEACLILFEMLKGSAEVSDSVSKFKTNVYRTKIIGIDKECLTTDFCRWLGEMFPNVKHLIILLHEDYEDFVCSAMLSFEHVIVLELSSLSGCTYYISTVQPAILCCKNLISLKLENFISLDVFSMARNLKKLEKLSLINNTYIRKDEIESFENLKVVELTIFEDRHNSSFKLYEKYMQLPCELLRSILSSNKVEKLLLLNQKNFTSSLMINLLNTGSLRSLKELKVFNSPIDIECILEIFNQKIPIKEIVVSSCENISKCDADEISIHILENYLTTSFTMVSEDPYNLRWIPQDIKVSM